MDENEKIDFKFKWEGIKFDQISTSVIEMAEKLIEKSFGYYEVKQMTKEKIHDFIHNPSLPAYIVFVVYLLQIIFPFWYRVNWIFLIWLLFV